MSIFSLAMLEAEWILAGGNPSAAPTAAAVAMAESHGDPNAIGHNVNGTIDRGLWQINSSHGSLSTFDPLANAKAAVQVSGNGANWQPWTTFQKGLQAPYISRANALLPHVIADIKNLRPSSSSGLLGIPGLDQAASGITSGLDTAVSAGQSVLSVGAALTKIVDFLTSPTNWLRIGEVIAGLVLIAMGLRSLTGFSVPTPAGAGRRIVTSAGMGEIIK